MLMNVPLDGVYATFKWISFLQKFKLNIWYQHLDEFDLYTNETLIEYILVGKIVLATSLQCHSVKEFLWRRLSPDSLSSYVS